MNTTVYFDRIASPLGPMVLASDGDALTGAWFDGQRHQPPVGPDWQRRSDLPILRRAAAALAEYFAGERTAFRPAAVAGGNAVPARRVGGDRGRALRRDDRVSGARRARRPTAGRSRGGRGHRAQPAVDRRALPSHHRRGRRADRLRRRARAQALAARARAWRRRRGARHREWRASASPRPPDRVPDPVRQSDVARLVLLAAIWGASFIFIRVLAPALGPVLTVTTRVLIGGAVLIAYCRAIGFDTGLSRHWRQYVVIGLVNSTLPFMLYAFAALHLPASYSVILNSTTPLFTALLAVPLLGERLTAGEDRGTRRRSGRCRAGEPRGTRRPRPVVRGCRRRVPRRDALLRGVEHLHEEARGRREAAGDRGLEPDLRRGRAAAARALRSAERPDHAADRRQRPGARAACAARSRTCSITA